VSGRGLIVVGGGARSGKSRFALLLARGLGTRRAFVATAQPFDAEMVIRIAAHRRERGTDFATVEEPLDLVQAVGRLGDFEVVLIDCLTLWISNMLLRGDDEAHLAEEVERLAAVLVERPHHTVVVTNEVGMGLVPETPLGRVFRDSAGRAHQTLARRAHSLYLAVLGSVLRLKPGPLSLVSPDEEGIHP